VVELRWPPRLHHPEYLAISPSGAVPAIEDGDLRLIESLAICEYVSRKAASDIHLEPSDPCYFEYLQLLQFGDATLAPPVGWARRLGPLSDKVAAEARMAFGLRLKVIEAALADGREHIAAGRFTIADISVAFTLTLAQQSGLGDLLPPAVEAYVDRMKARSAYQRAYAK
jgi:glutathione S-transferase